jgi:hypothetical protein
MLIFSEPLFHQLEQKKPDARPDFPQYLRDISEEDEEVKMLLGAAGTFKGRVVDKAGKPVAGVRVGGVLRLGPEDKPTVKFGTYTESDKDGRFTLPGLVQGARCYLFAAARNKPGKELKTLPIDRAETQDLGDMIYDPSEE